MQLGLTEGRIVHYVLENGEIAPAIIVKVWSENGTSNLHVFPWNAGGTELRSSVVYSEEPKPHTWHWISRV